jgi:hypothetical protein
MRMGAGLFRNKRKYIEVYDFIWLSGEGIFEKNSEDLGWTIVIRYEIRLWGVGNRIRNFGFQTSKMFK